MNAKFMVKKRGPHPSPLQKKKMMSAPLQGEQDKQRLRGDLSAILSFFDIDVTHSDRATDSRIKKAKRCVNRKH